MARSAPTVDIATPPGWRVIDVLAAMRKGELDDRLIAALESSRAGEQVRSAIRGALEQAAAACGEAGVIAIKALVEDTDGVPVFAQLAISILTEAPASLPAVPGEEGSLVSLDGAQISAMRLPAGDAIRVRKMTEARLTPDGPGFWALTLQYFVSSPDFPGLVVISLMTPQAALADSFTEMFDAMAETLVFETS